MPDTLTCSVRTTLASDGAELPVPVGFVGSYDEYGRPLEIKETAEVHAFPYGNGYYVTVNNAAPENGEAQELLNDVSAESMMYLAERVILEGAPKAIKFGIETGLMAAGLLADILTTSKLTRQTFIKAEVNGVPVTYCILT